MRQIASLVNRLIRKHQSTDPFQICKNMGIQILFTALGSISGVYTENYRIKMIIVNSELNDKDQKLACAHELGHLLLRHNMNRFFMANNTYCSLSKPELEANIFAVLLLGYNNKEDSLCCAEDDHCCTYIAVASEVKIDIEVIRRQLNRI